MLKIQGFLKLSEEDSYDEGCDPKTCQMYEDTHVNFQAETEVELLAKVKEFFSVEDNAIVVNSCGDAGRIDIQTMEDGEGNNPSKADMSAWKRGKKTLYACIYSLNAEKVESFTFGEHEGIENQSEN